MTIEASRVQADGFIDRARATGWADLLLFVAIALAIVATNWRSIDAHNIEYGDFAANGLLIQDAKAGRLWTGNYSRVGFNHPGPAILDVLAAGEFLFFDRLQWVSSPFSGQLVAVALYNAFWSVLVVRLWRGLSARRSLDVAGAATFLVAAALLDVRFFSGPWFPHLYFFPFATFLFAAARLATGRADRLQSLALSLGFLIEGHVAFVPICTIVLLFMLVANRAEFRRTDRARVLVDLLWWRQHRRPIVYAATILGVFALPLVVETVVHYPGPIADYLSFGSGRHHNNFIRSLRFVAAYWGGLPFLILPVLFWAATRSFRFEDEAWTEAVRALLAVAIAASFALLLYASFGVDQLSSTYIGYFYCAVPASMAALVFGCFVQSDGFRRRRKAAGATAVAAFAVACVNLDRHDDYKTFYRAPAIADLHRTLLGLKRDGRLVLDLEAWPGLQLVWPVVVGIELDARRRHEDLLCIGENWHILFTKQARCTGDELASSGHLIVLSSGHRPASGVEPVAEGLGVAFYPTRP